MYKDSCKVDILFLIEHRDRELDSICAITKELKLKYKLSVAIASLSFHTLLAAFFIRSKVVVIPFGWKGSDFPLSLFRAIYGKRVIYVNLNLEQILSPVNQEYKKPRDQFAKTILKQFCWSEAFKKYLLDNEVVKENIYLTGNPVTSLLIERNLRHKDFLKRYLAEKFKLPLNFKWIFFPMNCGWAFISDYQIKSRVKAGYDEKKAFAYKKYLNRTINIIFNWIAQIKDEIKDKNILFVLRPHPSVSVQQYKERFNELVGFVPDFVHIFKELTAKDWLVASDACYTNFSTVALDAQIIGKPVYLMVPEPFPDFLKMDWYYELPQLRLFSEFQNSFRGKFLANKKNLPILDEFVNTRLNGITESAKYLAQFTKEGKFVPFSPTGFLKGIFENPKQSLGSFIRLLIMKTGINTFQIVKPGVKADFFDRKDVIEILKRDW